MVLVLISSFFCQKSYKTGGYEYENKNQYF